MGTAKRPENTNVGTCHSEDYIACALVTAGCAAGDCSGKDNWFQCMTNCVINKHQAQCIDCIPKKVSTAKRSENTNVGTCHSEDYIACALVTAGCAAGDCSGKDDWMTCMTDCVINKHHKECIDCIHPH